MEQTYRVAHVGTGYTGSIALQQVLRSPRLELVGQLVHSPGKVGRDSGELVGEAAVGVMATDSLEAFLALEVDCVTYFASVSGRNSNEIVDQLSVRGQGLGVAQAPVLERGLDGVPQPRAQRGQCGRRAHLAAGSGPWPARNLRQSAGRFSWKLAMPSWGSGPQTWLRATSSSPCCTAE